MKPRREFGTLIGLATDILRGEDAKMRRCEEAELRCDRLARQPECQAPGAKSQRTTTLKLCLFLGGNS